LIYFKAVSISMYNSVAKNDLYFYFRIAEKLIYNVYIHKISDDAGTSMLLTVGRSEK